MRTGLKSLLGSSAGSKTYVEQEACPEQSTDIDETQITPVDGVPFPKAPVRCQTHCVYAVDVTKVGNEQSEQKRAPYLSARGGPKD